MAKKAHTTLAIKIKDARVLEMLEVGLSYHNHARLQAKQPIRNLSTFLVETGLIYTQEVHKALREQQLAHAKAAEQELLAKLPNETI